MQPINLYSGFFATVKMEDYCDKKDFENQSMFPNEFLQDQAAIQIVRCLYYSQV